jgi:hypothetical protein
VRRGIGIIAAVVLAGCSSPAASQAATHSPTPTPLPATPLTVPAAAAVTDVDHVDVAGSSAPGATISATWGVNSASVTADASGNFVVRVTGLAEGSTTLILSAVAAGDSPASGLVDIVRTVSPAFYKQQAATIPYNQLVKDPASLAGRIVTYRGQVFQYDSNTTTSHMIISVTDSGYGFWSDNIWVDVDPAAAQNVFQKNIIQVWGTVVGPYTYTTTQNGSLTIPEVDVKYVQLIG